MIYGYIRVSTDKQDTDNQKLGINAKASALGLTVEEWIEDNGISGTKEPDDRALGPLLAKINSEDTIITSELSRLGRSLFMVMRILEYCMKTGAKVYTVKDNYELGDNVQSKVLAFAFALAAEIERDMISRRTKEALAHKINLGVLVGHPRGPRKTEYLSKNQLEEMNGLLKQGMSLVKIAKKMGVHRITAAYHLAKNGYYKGPLTGLNVTFLHGNTLQITPRNCSQFGLSYKFLKEAYINKKDVSMLGITQIEPVHKDISMETRNYVQISDSPHIDRSRLERLIYDNLTLPEIHKHFAELIDYHDLYQYVLNDTELSGAYRTRGHLRVKSKRNGQ